MNFIQKILYLPDYLSGYGMGDPERNGECKFLRNFVKDGMVIFDVGANVGEYSEYIVQLAKNLEIHTFEPVKETFDELTRRINVSHNTAKVYFNNFGLSNECEEKEINIYGKLAGSNSIYNNEEIASKTGTIKKEKILLDTVDNYIIKNSISRIDLMKIDVEGYEPNVLFGAISSFNKSIIKAVQFEFGGFWKNSDYSLYDVIKFLTELSFKIYRLTPWGKILIPHYDKYMNNFKHSNYVALLL